MSINSNNPLYHFYSGYNQNLNAKIRSASRFCVNSLGIKVKDITKILPEEKSAIEFCLQENFLKLNKDYFGKRDYIFIDLN